MAGPATGFPPELLTFLSGRGRRYINQLIDYLNPNMRHWLMDEVTKRAQSSLRRVRKVFVERLLTILQDINSS